MSVMLFSGTIPYETPDWYDLLYYSSGYADNYAAVTENVPIKAKVGTPGWRDVDNPSWPRAIPPDAATGRALTHYLASLGAAVNGVKQQMQYRFPDDTEWPDDVPNAPLWRRPVGDLSYSAIISAHNAALSALLPLFYDASVSPWVKWTEERARGYWGDAPPGPLRSEWVNRQFEMIRRLHYRSDLLESPAAFQINGLAVELSKMPRMDDAMLLHSAAPFVWYAHQRATVPFGTVRPYPTNLIKASDLYFGTPTVAQLVAEWESELDALLIDAASIGAERLYIMSNSGYGILPLVHPAMQSTVIARWQEALDLYEAYVDGLATGMEVGFLRDWTWAEHYGDHLESDFLRETFYVGIPLVYSAPHTHAQCEWTLPFPVPTPEGD